MRCLLLLLTKIAKSPSPASCSPFTVTPPLSTRNAVVWPLRPLNSPAMTRIEFPLRDLQELGQIDFLAAFADQPAIQHQFGTVAFFADEGVGSLNFSFCRRSVFPWPMCPIFAINRNEPPLQPFPRWLVIKPQAPIRQCQASKEYKKGIWIRLGQRKLPVLHIRRVNVNQRVVSNINRV
jgi:hypothetical protein